MASRRRPAFVRLHPGDSGRGLAPAFFEHPKDFVPQADQHICRIDRWGIVEGSEDEDEGGMPASLMRTMTCQAMYFGGDTPERQFVKELIRRKEAAMEAGKEHTQGLYKRDFIVDLDLAYLGEDYAMKPRVWRRLRVSGGVSLPALADKVLTPAMGWVRNYHGHLFTDYKDGALLGDPESGSVDMMHVGMSYYAFMDERKWRLADLVQEPGQELGWRYDIGDNWRHVLKVVEVLPEADSTGRAAVLDGGGACPPEDSNGLDGLGCRAYQDFLNELQEPGYKQSRQYRETLRKASAALNYKGVRGGFDPERFVLADAQQRVEEALSSRASVTSGAKTFNMPISPAFTGMGMGMGGFLGGQPAPGQQVLREPAPGACDGCGRFMQETVSTGKDPRGVAVCFNCGNPNQLLTCSGCKLVRFCGRECQVESWPRHKRECKAEQARRAAAAGGAGSSCG